MNFMGGSRTPANIPAHLAWYVPGRGKSECPEEILRMRAWKLRLLQDMSTFGKSKKLNIADKYVLGVLEEFIKFGDDW